MFNSCTKALKASYLFPFLAEKMKKGIEIMTLLRVMELSELD